HHQALVENRAGSRWCLSRKNTWILSARRAVSAVERVAIMANAGINPGRENSRHRIGGRARVRHVWHAIPSPSESARTGWEAHPTKRAAASAASPQTPT